VRRLHDRELRAIQRGDACHAEPFRNRDEARVGPPRGNVAYVAHVQFLDPVPFPSVADVGYLGAYPFFVVAVLLLARAEVGAKQIAVWLDGWSVCLV